MIVLSGCIFTPPPKSSVVWEKETVSPIEDPIIRWAKAQYGIPYRYGGRDPERGFDCSGFVCYVYENAIDKKLPRTARAQSMYGKIIDKDALEPDDLLFFDTSGKGTINHVGIYLGNGKFIHASSGKVYSVTISSLKSGFYRRAFRFGGRINHR